AKASSRPRQLFRPADARQKRRGLSGRSRRPCRRIASPGVIAPNTRKEATAAGGTVNDPEFERWLEQHQGYFPGVETWLSKLSETRRDSVLGVWRKTLRAVSIDDAERASSRMFEADHVDRVYERHPSTIRRIAGEISTRRGGTPQPSACNYCHGE